MDGVQEEVQLHIEQCKTQAVCRSPAGCFAHMHKGCVLKVTNSRGAVFFALKNVEIESNVGVVWCRFTHSALKKTYQTLLNSKQMVKIHAMIGIPCCNVYIQYMHSWNPLKTIVTIRDIGGMYMIRRRGGCLSALCNVTFCFVGRFSINGAYYPYDL